MNMEAQQSLLDAVLKRDVFTVKLLLDQGTNVNVLDHLRRTPLHLAVLKSDADIVELLLERGANVNDVGDVMIGQTPLHCVALNPHVKIAKILLKHGANVNASDNSGRTPLHFIVPKPHLDIAKLLLEHGANANALDIYRRTPLHQYKLEPHVDIVKLLFEHGANVNALDYRYRTPLHYAVKNGYVNTVKLLLQLGTNVRPLIGKQEPILHDATAAPHLEIVKLLLEHGANGNPFNQVNRTPLNIFAYYHCVSIVRLLLDYRADVNNRDDFGHTPLLHSLFAANNLIKESTHVVSRDASNMVNAYETIKLLLENGAIPDFENETNVLVEIVDSKDYFAELLIQYVILNICVSDGMFEVLNQFKSVLSLHFAEDSDNYKHFSRIAHLCCNEIKNMKNDFISDQTVFQFVSNNCFTTATHDHSVSLYDIDALLILLKNGKYVVCRDLIYGAIKRSVVVDRLCELKVCYQTADSNTVVLNYDCINNLNNYMLKDDVINLSIVFCDEFNDHKCSCKCASKINAEKK